MKRGWRCAGLALGSLVGLALAPAPAVATVASIDSTTLRVKAAAGEANNLVVSYIYDGTDLEYKYLITEQGDGVSLTSPSAGCAPFGADPPQLACDAAGITHISIDTRDEGDEVSTNGAIPTTIPVAIKGGRGGDHVNGGQAGEKIRGQQGNDVINAGGLAVDDPGDILIGGKGRDTLMGDYGYDLLKAKDHERDKLLDCGEGDDPRPIRDKGLDPKPVNCENVTAR